MRNKVHPVPPPRPIKEIRITKSPAKKVLKVVLLVLIVTIISVGVWIGFVANNALSKITDGGAGSNILSLLSDFSTGNLKGKIQGRTNILVLGMGGKNHPGGTLSDTMISMSINYSDNKVGMISVPRDLWVPISGYGHAKINEAYYQGESNKKTTGGGGTLASKTVENVLGVPMHYYVSMDFEGFKKIIATVGGIDVYVEKDIYDPYYPADNMIDYAPFKISAGMHHMNGELALKYARSRKTTSDFDRSRRQMQVVAATKEKILSLGILANPKKIADLINVLGDHIRTNMQVSEIKTLLDVSKNLDTNNIINKVLDTSTGGLLVASQDSRGYYTYPKKGMDNFSEIQNMAKNIFVETNDDEEAVKIEISNAAEKNGLATSVSHFLESYGYPITKVDTATSTREKTTVYDYSGGKYKNTAQKIADLLKTQVENSPTVREDVHIQVLIGKDYISNQ